MTDDAVVASGTIEFGPQSCGWKVAEPKKKRQMGLLGSVVDLSLQGTKLEESFFQIEEGAVTTTMMSPPWGSPRLLLEAHHVSSCEVEYDHPVGGRRPVVGGVENDDVVPTRFLMPCLHPRPDPCLPASIHPSVPRPHQPLHSPHRPRHHPDRPNPTCRTHCPRRWSCSPHPRPRDPVPRSS